MVPRQVRIGRSASGTFFQELKKRRVYRVALAYAVAGSALVQIAGTVLPIFYAPNWVQQVFVALIAFGFPIALVFAWVFDVKRGAIVRTPTSPGGRSLATSRRVWILAGVGLLLASFAFLTYEFWHPWKDSRDKERLAGPSNGETTSVPAISEKSIAVLPFENLSDDKENAYFTDGVQDEILTALAKVADLKVISRTSVMQYKTGAGRNLPDIAKALGVAHCLEGSVQRTGGRVRINAQLIDARSDRHIWAEHYDRDLADVFAIQRDVAEEIVAQLKAKISPQEKAALEESLTSEPAAYDLYLRAKAVVSTTVFNARGKDDFLEGARFLEQAIVRDPNFFLAYYQLARVHDQIYFIGYDHTPARLALAYKAVQALVRLRPDAGETHLALAEHLYWGYLDYDKAREELTIARRSLPKDPLALRLASYIDRRQGRWEESIRSLERALEVDPRNFQTLQQIALSYMKLRRYNASIEALDRSLAIVPHDIGTQVFRAGVDLEWRADPKPLHSAIQRIVAENPNAVASLADTWLNLALCERDYSAADRALAAMAADGSTTEGVAFPKTWWEGLAARTKADTVAGQSAFIRARGVVEKIVREQPSYAEAICVLGMIDAALGRKEEAISEGRRAVALLPVTKDSIDGALLLCYLAVIYAWAGEKDLAIEQLALAAHIPGDVSYGQLRLHPYWDPLRGDPRFEKIVAMLAPPGTKALPTGSR